jgi:hypothetical protein
VGHTSGWGYSAGFTVSRVPPDLYVASALMEVRALMEGRNRTSLVCGLESWSSSGSSLYDGRVPDSSCSVSFELVDPSAAELAALCTAQVACGPAVRTVQVDRTLCDSATGKLAASSPSAPLKPLFEALLRCTRIMHLR